MKYAKIVPVDNPSGGLCKTQGTNVVLPDGSSLPGVTKIVLTAEPNDIWKAEIHCLVLPPDEIVVAATFVESEKPEPDEQGAVDVTSLQDSAMRFEA